MISNHTGQEVDRVTANGIGVLEMIGMIAETMDLLREKERTGTSGPEGISLHIDLTREILGEHPGLH